MLVLAIGAFATCGRGILAGIVLTIAGGRSVLRGVTKWQAERRLRGASHRSRRIGHETHTSPIADSRTP